MLMISQAKENYYGIAFQKDKDIQFFELKQLLPKMLLSSKY